MLPLNLSLAIYFKDKKQSSLLCNKASVSPLEKRVQSNFKMQKEDRAYLQRFV